MKNKDVVASLRYLKRTSESPVYYASRAGVSDRHDIGLEFEERQVNIDNARALQTPPSLDEQGFALYYHVSRIADFYHLEERRAEYDAELTALIESISGASKALVFDHTIRSDSASVREQRSTREPANFIHNDYTPRSALKRLHELLEPAEAALAENSHWAIINVWRSINGVVHNSPITCCDAASVAPADLVAVERRAHDRVGEIEFVNWNPRHRWYYFPEMQTDEVLLIKTFDSKDSRQVTRTIHSAFQHPLTAADAPPRESIESRLLVLF